MNLINYSVVIILIIGFYPLGYYLLDKLFEIIIEKAKHDREFKNEMASITYMIISFAPPICSFAIVSAVTAEEKNVLVLLIIFVVGIVINHYGRKLRTALFERTKVEIPGFKKSDYMKVMKGSIDEIHS